MTHPEGTRTRSYLAAVGSGYALLLANAATYAIFAPWFLRRLGAAEYGIWLVLLQIVYVASLATTWVAAPVVREAARACATGDAHAARRLLQTGASYYGVLGALALTLAAVLLPSVPTLFQIPHDVAPIASQAFGLMAAYFAALLQLNLLTSVLAGYQHMHVGNVLLMALTVLGTGLGAAAVFSGEGVRGLALGQLGAVVAAYLGAVFFVWKRIGVWPFGAGLDTALLRRLLGEGPSYLAYSISYLLLQSDLLLIALVLGPAPAALYGIAYKVVDYAVQLIWKIPDSLVPFVAELHATGDVARLQTAHRLTTKVSLAAAILGGLLVLGVGRQLVALWFGPEYAPEPALVSLLAVHLVFQVFVHSALTIPYGAGRMRPVAVVALAEGVFKVVVTIVLLRRLGVVGAAMATVLAQLAFTAWYVPRSACSITGDRFGRLARAVVAPAVPAAIAGGAVLLLVGPDVSSWLRMAWVTGATASAYAAVFAWTGIGRTESEMLRTLVGRHAVS